MLEEEVGTEIHLASGVSGAGLDQLKFKLLQLIETIEEEPASVITPVYKHESDSSWGVEELEEGVYKINGARIERLVAMTQLQNKESLQYMRRKLQNIGVVDALEEAGIEEGDTVVVGDMEFEYRGW